MSANFEIMRHKIALVSDTKFVGHYTPQIKQSVFCKNADFRLFDKSVHMGGKCLL